MKKMIFSRIKPLALTVLMVFLSLSLCEPALYGDSEEIGILKNRLIELEKRDIENRVLIKDMKDLLFKLNSQNQMILEKLVNQDELISTIPRRVPRPQESIEMEDISPREVDIKDEKQKRSNSKNDIAKKSNSTPRNTVSDEKSTVGIRSPDSEKSLSTGEKKRLYDSAFKLYTITSYDNAITKFREFIDKYPDDDLTDNAQYWIGECHLKKKEYLKAIDEFQNVVEYYPLGNKVPEAYLKIGYAYLYLKDKVSAVQYFKQVMDMFPNTDASAEAERKLKEISFR